MCDPLTIGGALLTAGGAAANYAASNSVNSARNDVMNAERIRQQGLNHEAAAINEGSRARYDDFNGQQAQKSNDLATMFTAPPQVTGGSPAQPLNVMPTSTSDATNNEIVNRDNVAKAFTDQQGAARGNLRSFGEVMGDIGRPQAEDATKVGQLGGFKQASTGVEQLELNNANNAGNGLTFLGDIMGGLGKVGVSAGLANGTLGNLFGTPKAAAAAASGAVRGISPAALATPSMFRLY